MHAALEHDVWDGWRGDGHFDFFENLKKESKKVQSEAFVNTLKLIVDRYGYVLSLVFYNHEVLLYFSLYIVTNLLLTCCCYTY